jgi:hypothetical protein
MPRVEKNSKKTAEAVHLSMCLPFAQLHGIMILALLLFFGVLVVPFSTKKIRLALYSPVMATVDKITAADQKQSQARLRYTVAGKIYHADHTFKTLVTIGSSFTLYHDPHHPEKSETFRPSLVLYGGLLTLYLLILVLYLAFVGYLYLHPNEK